MTAYRVVDEHSELSGSGNVPHADIDAFVSGTFYVILSGSSAAPPAARRLTAGPGITFVDGGPGGTITVSSTTANTVSWMEVVSGSADGVNTGYGVMHTPLPSGSLMLFVNGLLQRQGVGFDYTLSGSFVSMSLAPQPGANIVATYPY
jgi:hypothetical protein